MGPFPWLPFLSTVAVIVSLMTVVVRAGSRTNFTISDWVDPLIDPVPPFPPTDDLLRIPVAVDENRRPIALPLLGNQLLIAGVTGAGKGSCIWSLVAGAQPARDLGLLEIRAVDPKGGMELGIGSNLLDELVDNVDDAAELLEQAVEDMDDRARRLAAAGIRKLQPTPDEPLVVVLIDELADLLASPDRELRDRCHQALQSLLRKGRAVGFCVIAATQDARVEVVAMRNLFRQRIALRGEANQADMILGIGAREAGAQVHRIPARSPGIAYLLTEGGRPRRIRFSYLDDDTIRQLNQEAA